MKIYDIVVFFINFRKYTFNYVEVEIVYKVKIVVFLVHNDVKNMLMNSFQTCATDMF